jgi:hypothetical protein
MVLKTISLFILAGLCGCATTGYQRYGVFDEKRDRIYQHRASFVDDGRISMAYAIVYWDALAEGLEKEERMPEIYYVWLRNNTSLPVTIDPDNLYLFTEKGERIPLSPVTGRTVSPLKRVELPPYGVVEGYAAFDIPTETIVTDKPSRLVYDDTKGNRAVRYLLVEDMKRYEGLVLEEPTVYYAPIYPRDYWYPYYYPYAYYPYDLRLFFFYRYEPRRRYYYYIPLEPERRKFYTPSPPGEREFKRPSPDIEKKREFK